MAQAHSLSTIARIRENPHTRSTIEKASRQQRLKVAEASRFAAAARWLEKRGHPRVRPRGGQHRWTARPKSGFLGASQVRGGTQKKPLTQAQIRDLLTHREPREPERLPRKVRKRLERENRSRGKRGGA